MTEEGQQKGKEAINMRTRSSGGCALSKGLNEQVHESNSKNPPDIPSGSFRYTF